jgi:hypothetical protein
MWLRVVTFSPGMAVPASRSVRATTMLSAGFRRIEILADMSAMGGTGLLVERPAV